MPCIFSKSYTFRYGSLTKAAAKPDGLAVLGTFFQIKENDNEFMSEFTSKLKNFQEPQEGKLVKVFDLSLANFIPSKPYTSEFYRYKGSLTTPGCFESVIWTVFRHSLPISEDQMSSFRALFDGQGRALVNNFRPLQPLNGR